MKSVFYLPKKLFDGQVFFENIAIEVAAGEVLGLVPRGEIPRNAHLLRFENDIIAPAFKDLQINGGNKHMFALDPSVETLTQMYKYSVAGGATAFLATVASSSFDAIYEAIYSVSKYWEEGLPGLMGLHLEGPFINPVKRGAHLQQYIKKPSLSDVEKLVQVGGSVIKMITIAPECFSDDIIKYLVKQGIVLSAGHSNASYEEAKHGFDLGIRSGTHLYNAMSRFHHRKPGLVGAILDGDVFCGIIPDGIHCSDVSFRIANRLKGDQLYFVTDAVAEYAGKGYEYIRENDYYVDAKGVLAGSALTMVSGVKKAIDMGVRKEDALRRASFVPCQVMGESKRYGRIAPGYLVDWVLINELTFDLKMVITG